MNAQNEHLVKLIDGLRAAKERHYSWLWDIHRALLCEVPLQPHIELNPHHCEFAKWMASVSDEPLARYSDYYQAVYQQHILMHQTAKMLIDSASRQRPVPVKIYDEFIKQRDNFKESVERFERDLWDMACLVDQLTGLRNRYGMLTDLIDEQQRVSRDKSTCSIAMVDLDRFKDINDNYGHLAGDLLLQRLATLLKSKLRAYDHLYRYGGEEFLICMPGTATEEAKIILERMRKDIEEMEFTFSDKRIPVTASFGLTPIGTESCIEDYIEHADSALYAAKYSGRNRVQVYDRPM